MKLYRLMCDEEFNSVCEKHPFSWNKSCKWFTDDVEFLQRVSDKELMLRRKNAQNLKVVSVLKYSGVSL